MNYDNTLYEELRSTREKLQTKYNKDKETLLEMRNTLDQQIVSLRELEILIQDIDNNIVNFSTVKYIKDNNFIVYHYVLETDFCGMDSFGYLLVKRECDFDIDEYLDREARENLESYGLMTPDDYEAYQEEVEDEEEEVNDYSISDYSYFYKEVTIDEILNGGYDDFDYKEATIISE